MGFAEAIRDYYSLFGIKGVWLAANARIAGKRPEVIVAVHGIRYPVTIRLRTTDSSVLRQVFILREYAFESVKSARAIIDAGANIGLTSVFYANVYPKAQIFAIEPEASNYNLLLKNVRNYSNIVPVQAALWGRSEQLWLFDAGKGHVGFQTQSGDADADIRGRVPTRGITLHQLVKEHSLESIDILKVDIEGSEIEVFGNSEDWIDLVSSMAVELHDRIRPGCRRSLYASTRNFVQVFEKGETIFLRRKDSPPASSPKSPYKTPAAAIQPRFKRPCHIVKAG